MSPVSRREFLCTGGALIAATCVPEWARRFSPPPATTPGAPKWRRRRWRTRRRSARRTPTSASTATAANRSRRASGRCRTCRGRPATGFGLRVLVNGAWGFAATNRVEPGAARAAAEQAVAIARANAVLATRKVVLANADKVVDHLDQPVQARSVRGAARNQDRVPDEAERDGAGRAGRHASSARRSCSSTSRSTSPRAKARGSRSGWCAPIRSSRTTAADRASGDFQTRAVVDRAQAASATNTSRTIRGCRMPRRPATKWSRS